MKQFLIIISILSVMAIGCSENNTTKLESTSSVVEKNTSLDSINSLIKEDPNNPDLYFERAKIYYSNRDLVSSMSDVGRSLKLDSSNADYYILLADLKLISKESRASRNALLKAYAINPNNIDVLLKLGELYMIVQDSKASFNYLNQALKIDVYNATAYRLKGFNYKYLGDTVNAISSFQTAVEQDPEDYDSYLQLGLLFAEGEHDLAIDYFNNALKVKPNSLEAFYAKGLYYQTTDRPREAIRVYNELLSKNNEYFDAWYNIGYIHLEILDKYDSAAYCFNQAIAFGPEKYFPAVYNRGLSREKSGDFKKAEDDYREALRLNPQYDLAARGLSRVLGE
ncbi:MAG: tetratricopeptide repeat protein [Salibacteraceae bacterium]